MANDWWSMRKYNGLESIEDDKVSGGGFTARLHLQGPELSEVYVLGMDGHWLKYCVGKIFIERDRKAVIRLEPRFRNKER